MDYAEARTVFFQPRENLTAPRADVTPARRLRDATPARRLRDAIEPIATIHYWSEPSSKRYAALGLDFLTGYVYSRASVLGEPNGAVVGAAFGVFEPSLVASLYDAARATCTPDEMAEARVGGVIDALREALTSTEAVAQVVTALRRGLAAADPTSRTLFAGVAAQPWPDDELARLWQACCALREFRGDSHLIACAAAGLTGLQANLLTELHVGFDAQAYTASRGWTPGAMDTATAELGERGLIRDGALTEEGTAMRTDIEQLTDRQLAPVVDAIGDQLEDTIAATERWSQQIIDAGWFPPDPYKRAAG